ncbi:T9SS type A sorting domain-containing protein [Flammeovirga pacifica]|uniref:Secretion system C-terminal sorting domain-containing protein n=1 Tax=Flammeovirga pacifica TaxID=915059 RepID=A0A1S1Z113_FLAPC|nr:T9SS type A sorting domain-containing protein [Flammeovirga pacifica]OHX66932.1 hypothetical protein NH26_11540 [Flammeovirga pacifica]
MTKYNYSPISIFCLLLLSTFNYAQCDFEKQSGSTDFTSSGLVSCNTTSAQHLEFIADGANINISHIDNEVADDGIDFTINTESIFGDEGGGMFEIGPASGDFTDDGTNKYAEYSVHWTIKANTHVLIKGDLILHYGTEITIESGGVLEIDGDMSLANSNALCQECFSGDIDTREAATEEYEKKMSESIIINNENGGVIQVKGDSDLYIDLIYFTGKRNDNIVELYWGTASEINSSHFEIEKSYDQKQWETVGNVLSAGNSSVNIEYSFMDSYNSISNYYRLVEIDLNGKRTYYGPINIAEKTSALNVNMYPNILSVGDPLVLTLNNLSKNLITEVKVFDLKGRLVLSNEYEVDSYNMNFTIQSNNSIPRGMYIVYVVNGSESNNMKFVVR